MAQQTLLWVAARARAEIEQVETAARELGIRVRTCTHQDVMDVVRQGRVNIVGLEVDLDLCELLFTSLLVQSSRALDELAESPEARGRSFRKSFLIAYAHRIGQRLLEARERATKAASEHHGSALLPILAERSDAVNKAFTAMYPSTTEVRIEARDHAGRRAGRAAAERADLTGFAPDVKARAGRRHPGLQRCRLT